MEAVFEDGTEATGSLLMGANGTRSSVHSLLVGPDSTKTHHIGFATTHCFHHVLTRQGSLLAFDTHQPLFRIAPHPEVLQLARTSWWLGFKPSGKLALLALYPVPWTSNFREHENSGRAFCNQQVMAAHFADPWRSSCERMPDDAKKTWYGKSNHWGDPPLPVYKWDNWVGLNALGGDAAHPMTCQRRQGLNHALVACYWWIIATRGWLRWCSIHLMGKFS